jgi:hypothetical protein
VIAEYLKGIPGIETVGIIALLACMAAFAAVVIRTFRAKAEDLSRHSRIPLEDGAPHHDHSTER